MSSTPTGNIELPLQQARFLVEIGTKVVAAFQNCSGLSLEYEVEEYAEGGNNEFVHKLIGRAKYTNITLKRGVTADPEFLKWRPKATGGKITVERKNVSIKMFNHGGQTIKTWNVAEAFPVKWSGPELQATSMEVAIETLELAHQGWVEK